MTINHVLAVVAVSDFDASLSWYQRFLDSPATNVPMPGTLAEWRLTNGGWLQMHRDPELAGHGLVNLAVEDLDASLRDLRKRAVEHGAVIEANKGVRLSPITDPDGNIITLIGGFRPAY